MLLIHLLGGLCAEEVELVVAEELHAPLVERNVADLADAPRLGDTRWAPHACVDA
jgi:hypothetical protein